MRLTLRTLLAWRDGMLDPAAAAELGDRVAASPAAGQLHDRIREVGARQMLSAPPPTGSGLAADANSTAEYLDNVLPGERIEEFERVCFGSDMHLAEAAGCHEILAEIHCHPGSEGAVDRTTVARLLAAARAAEGRDSDATDHEAPGRLDRPRGSGRRSTERPVGSPTRASATAWLLVIAATLLLVALLGGLGWSIGRGRGGRVTAEPRELSVAPAEVAPAPGVASDSDDEDPRAHPGAAPAADPVPQDPAVAPVEPVVAAPEPIAGPEPPRAEPSPVASAVSPAAAAPAAKPAGPPVAAPLPPAGGPAVPFGDALAIAARPVEAAAVPERVPFDAGDAAGVAVPAAPPADAGVVAGAAPLLVRRAAADGWDVAGDGTPIHLPAELLAPAVGTPTVVVDGIHVVLRPGARAGLARGPDGMVRLEVVFGSAVVAAADGRRLGVAAGGLHGTLADLTGPVAIDVALDRPPGGEPEAAVTQASIVAAAAATFVPEPTPDGRPAPVGVGPRCAIAGAALEPPAAAAAVRWSSVEPGLAGIEPLGESPAWLAGSWPTQDSDRAAAAAFAARLRPGVDVVEALRGLAADRRGENRSAAVATLALLGDYAPLAEQLCTEDPRRMLYERQWRGLATETVSLALARGSNAATKLRAALAEAGPPGAGGELVPLAGGFSDEDLAAGADARLVAALESPHLVVRRWALANLVAIVRPPPADEVRYRADAAAEARRAGVAWWRGLLDRGLIRRAADAAPQAGRN